MSESFAMNGGDGTYSYTKNSNYQRTLTINVPLLLQISRFDFAFISIREASNIAREMIKEAIVERLDTESLTSTSNKFCIVDLGCSVGPNTFFAVQHIVEAIENKHNLEEDLGLRKLEFQVFFNDHISNDFNTLFTSLPPERKYFTAGVPGSFYDQLFPSSSIHFAHSSYSLQWLSKVPEKLLDQNSPSWNKGRIHYTGASDEVVSAYASQFEKDMGIFLKARAKEIVPGGMIVLIIPGIPDEVQPSELPAGILFSFLGKSLLDMVNEGILNEAQIDSFNLPIYSASPREMASLVKRNGCFSIETMEMTDPRSKIDDPVNVQSLIMHLRAAMEGIFTKHFGSEIVDEMFKRTLKRSADISLCLDSGYKEGTQLFVVLKHK
ncbi:hypothetical protein ACH5RR_029817 [Cinchona calisaya]|uniref:S-adenosylmethionine-dependent methyltransferase n=1 Tax=Cinchona calisaya TaxID=153742 RepID=A0ABD2YV20_9GENT